jgi:phosphoglycolate phosphatase
MSPDPEGRRLVVFDLDGTLIDSQRIILATMAAAFAALDRPAPPAAEVLAIVGLSLPVAMATLAPWATPDEIAALVAAYLAHYDLDGGPSPAAPLYPGARSALERLAAQPGTLLGVATGKERRGLDHALASHGLGHFFATFQTADGHPSKPHPAMLRAALAETGCAPGRAVMVGDTEFDVAMGRAAGLAAIGVAWGYHPRARLVAAGADLVIDAFDALDDALETLWRRTP